MKMSWLVVSLLAAPIGGCASAQDALSVSGSLQAERATSTRVIDIWPNGAPGSESWTQKEITEELGLGASKSKIVRNVVRPTMTAYLPDPANATGAAVIVAPGGGFMMLSIDSEGNEVAKWLAERGIAAFVLKYRLLETPPDQSAFIAQLTKLLTGVAREGDAAGNGLTDRAKLGGEDGVEALKIVRAHAGEWGYSPTKVGFLGFSAGAFVTTYVVANSDASLRPDFAAPIYGGAFDAAAGIPKNLPPLFLAVAQDDQLLASSTIKMADQLRTAGYKPAFHLYASGGHGFGMNKQGKASDHWIDEFYWWMQEQGILKAQ